MYVPEMFEEKRVEILHDLIRSYPFGTIVMSNEHGLNANHLPCLLDSEPGPFGTLYAHVARANPLWRELSREQEVLAIFQGPQRYISPSWYVTKTETGMVVPTWNYAVVHAHGHLEAIEDTHWLREFVEKLTNTHEAGKAQPWSVSDAPAEYLQKQLASIIGLKLSIKRLVGKYKLSQNRPSQDRTSVIHMLRNQQEESALAMAGLMENTTK